MPRCPQCNKAFDELPRRCPTCLTDLDLLVEYVSSLRSGLEQAEQFTRVGELGQAVWTYLAVLEVDPDNATARRQVSQVASAVRQFDRLSPMRRWLGQQRGEIGSEDSNTRWRWLWAAVTLLLVMIAFGGGYLVGGWTVTADETPTQQTPEPPGEKDRPLTG